MLTKLRSSADNRTRGFIGTSAAGGFGFGSTLPAEALQVEWRDVDTRFAPGDQIARQLRGRGGESESKILVFPRHGKDRNFRSTPDTRQVSGGVGRGPIQLGPG